MNALKLERGFALAYAKMREEAAQWWVVVGEHAVALRDLAGDGLLELPSQGTATVDSIYPLSRGGAMEPMRGRHKGAT
ncbi:hypothetical protein KDW25_36890 [Burkholderia cenocepacia]|uniref:hypothetical protein n=1 Tax=Burkholderia cenocepacia TaxID=95486 RepID=UPI001B94708B|nr:hypothetical protein [Burkholderia cenocepacia]MBR8494601.1 hypothetical protein [Burkholderia cenocepacia]